MDTGALGSKAKHRISHALHGVSRYGIGFRLGIAGLDSSRNTYLYATSLNTTNDICAFASTASGSGFDLGEQTSALDVFSDDGGTALTGNRRGIRSRLLVTAAHVGALSLAAIMGQVKVAGGVDYDADYLAGLYGYIELASTSDFTLNSAGHAVCGVRSRIELSDNVTCDTTGTYIAGVFCELNTTAASKTVTQTGSYLAAFAAAVTDQKADKWGSVLFAKAEAADMGVYIGEHSSTAAGSGIDISGSFTRANRFHADDGGTVITGSNRSNILSRLLLTAIHTGGSLAATQNQVKIAGGDDFDGSYVCGSYNYLELAGATNLGLDAKGAACATRSRVEVAASIDVESGFLCGHFIELNTTGAYTITQTSILAAIVVTTTDQENDDWGAAIYIDGCDHAMYFGADSQGAISASAKTPTGAATHAIKVYAIDAAGYIPVYDDAAFNADD